MNATPGDPSPFGTWPYVSIPMWPQPLYYQPFPQTTLTPLEMDKVSLLEELYRQVKEYLKSPTLINEMKLQGLVEKIDNASTL